MFASQSCGTQFMRAITDEPRCANFKLGCGSPVRHVIFLRQSIVGGMSLVETGNAGRMWNVSRGLPPHVHVQIASDRRCFVSMVKIIVQICISGRGSSSGKTDERIHFKIIHYTRATCNFRLNSAIPCFMRVWDGYSRPRAFYLRSYDTIAMQMPLPPSP